MTDSGTNHRPRPRPGRCTRRVQVRGEGNSFYEAGVGVKSPAAGSLFTWRFFSSSFLQVPFALVGPVRLTVRARIARHHLLSVPALFAGHPMLHAPQAGKTNRIRTRRPIYQDGRAWRMAQEIHGHLDQLSTRPQAHRLHDSALGLGARLEQPRAAPEPQPAPTPAGASCRRSVQASRSCRSTPAPCTAPAPMR